MTSTSLTQRHPKLNQTRGRECLPVEVSGIVSSDIPFYVNASTERHVDYRPAADFAGETLEIYSGRIYGGGGGVYISVYDVVAGFVALKMIGPFVEAFASKLGERLGESVATAAARILRIRLSFSLTK